MNIFTIGHSNHEFSSFVSLLADHRIDAIADVRSSPYSTRFPQFDQRTLRPALKQHGIAYVFFGETLGGRPDPAMHTIEGFADYDRMASLPGFEIGLQRLADGMKRFRMALMCAEAEPSECHRALLVSRALASRSVEVLHILRNGELESQVTLEARLLEMAGLTHDDLFSPLEMRLHEAYRRQSAKTAWRPEIGEGEQ